MNIDDFRYITTIAELGTFSGAAKELFIAQPSLSQGVKYIETSYGITIFTRDSRGVRLTEDGECFVRYANDILNSEADLRQEIAKKHSQQNPIIYVGTTQLISSFVFDLLIQEFNKISPNTQYIFITGTSQELQEMILSGKVNIAIIYNTVNIDPKIAYQVLYQDFLVVVPAAGGSLNQKIVSSPSKGYEPVDLSYLDGEIFALPPENMYLSKRVQSISENSGISLNIRHNAKNYDMLYNLAKNGIASTILLESYFNPNSDYIPYYYLDSNETCIPISIIWRKGSYIQETVREIINITSELFDYQFNRK